MLAGCELVVDVGAVYDAATGRFDHHQRGGAGVRENGVPFSAFGLVWRHYGVQIAGSERVAALVDEGLVQNIDASDNGVTFGTTLPAGMVPYNTSSVLGDFVPTWDEEPRDFDDAFGRAVEFAGGILARVIAQAQAVARQEAAVAAAIAKAGDDPVVKFDRYSFDWSGLVADSSATAQFVVYPSEDGTYWFIQAVPPRKGSFEMRQPLPAAWAGKRGEALAEASGVTGAIFCHPGRFIGGAATLEGVRAMAARTCPLCAGSGQWTDRTYTDGIPREMPCPRCK